MHAYIFPGQGSQVTEMGKTLFQTSKQAQLLFEQANQILGFNISKIMFEGTEEELKQTSVTQPAVFLYSTIRTKTLTNFSPQMVAGHSLGEFSALVANNCLSFEDGLILVAKRAEAMQRACNQQASTMAAIIGIEDEIVENICKSIENEIVVAANYNCPGQLVISGTEKGVEIAILKLKEAGARMAVKLPVNGAFHSPLMLSAKADLEKAILQTPFNTPICPIFQNVDGKAHIKPETIQQNLIAQLTAPVRWTQTMQNMLIAGASEFFEVGATPTLGPMLKRIDRKIKIEQL